MAIDRRFIGSLSLREASEIHSFGATSRKALQVDSAREYARVTSHAGACRYDVRRFVSVPVDRVHAMGALDRAFVTVPGVRARGLRLLRSAFDGGDRGALLW